MNDSTRISSGHRHVGAEGLGVGGVFPRGLAGPWVVWSDDDLPPSSVTRRPSSPLVFDLSEEDASVVIPTARLNWAGSDVASADGIAYRTGATRLELAGLRAVTLTHNLPSSIDLRSLLGQTLRVTLVNDGGASQTLSISGVGGRVWLVARFGPVHGIVHSFGVAQVRAALSQRPAGPLVVGTERFQWLVNAGCHVRLGGAAHGLVVEHIARPTTESAAYVIADSAIYGC